MSSQYWPIELNIAQCIRTEAEELSEHVLLAVHEPMQLEQKLAGEPVGHKSNENELLDHLIKTERPIPVIGESGIGKSHIIRWIDAQLKLKNNADWHIIRIPKNASLRQVLNTLLDGLDGESFKKARDKVNEVGERLKTQEVADHLVIFIGHRLAEIHKNVEEEIESLQKNGQHPSIEDKKRIKRVRRHAKRNGLPALLGDSNYKELLVSEGKCLYQIAKRLTSGGTEQELEENNYKIRIEDLDFSLHISDLSSIAQQYIRDASLNTDLASRQEAADLLNEVINDACSIAFSQFFQFHSGGFQELFVEIRKYLHDQNKTLFILVEDMAAISAIEDVLIDSLIQESVRDGVQELCSLHSVIAVTDGYSGYTRRRNTLATRAGIEWFINKTCDSEEETYIRIENFCGRYLNAARYGTEALKTRSWSTGELHIWESEYQDKRERIECFERSNVGFSLFPYNKAALKALADKYCRPHGDLEFNPRKILKEVLRPILLNFRHLYSESMFPPAGLADYKCSTILASELTHELTLDLERVKTSVAIWGYGADDLTELPRFLPSEIAKEFSLNEFSDVLQGIIPSQKKRPLVSIHPKPIEKVTLDSSSSVENDLRQIVKDLDTWFDKKNIPQDEAKILRKILVNEIGYINPSWYGIKKLPDLKKGKNIILINIPYNKNNPNVCALHFASEEIFNDEIQSLPYREFILAVLRKNKSVGSDSDSWDYQGGFEDYCTYINFINTWVPEQIQKLVETERKKTKDILQKHLGIASAFDPIITGRTIDEKINMLVSPANYEKDDLGKSLEEKFSKTGIDEWDVHLEELRMLWLKNQAEWLNFFSTNRHALEADLIKKELRGLSGLIPTETKKCAQSVTKSLNKNFQLFDFLDSCSTEEQFKDVLGNLHNLVSKLSSENQFRLEDNSFTARKFLNLIFKIKEKKGYWNTCKALLTLKEGFNDTSIKHLSLIDLKLAEEINECLIRWKQFYVPNIERMKFENSQIGGDKREADRKIITQQINNTTIQLKSLEVNQ